MRFLVLISVLFAAGCAETSPTQVAESKCDAYGFTEPSESRAQCIQVEVHKLEEQRRMQALALYGLGTTMKSQSTTPNTLTCTTTTQGVFTNTSCY